MRRVGGGPRLDGQDPTWYAAPVDRPILEPSPFIDIHAPDNVRVRGTRIDICQLVLDQLEGRLPEETRLSYSSLDLAAFHGVIAYCFEHREAVNQDGAMRNRQARELVEAYGRRPEHLAVRLR